MGNAPPVRGPARAPEDDSRTLESPPMKMWVDADACPGPIKDLILRAARRLQVPAVFVANKHIGLPDSPYLSAVRIGADPEAVDQYLVRQAREGDLVVTQDIPLASALVRKGVVVITPRGELHTGENIGERLAMRNFMQEIREAGVITPPHKPFSSRDKQRFSDTLDRELTRLFNAKSPRG